MVTSEQDRIVKVFLSAAEHRLLKLAAANKDRTTSGFVREVALAAAANDMQAFTPPAMPEPPASSAPKHRRQVK